MTSASAPRPGHRNTPAGRHPARLRVEPLEDRATPAGWALGFGGPNGDRASAVAVDAQGNVYVAGDFRQTADFDPGPGQALLTSKGYSDLYLAKYDPDGQFLWARRFGGAGDDRAGGVVAGDAGSVYVCGGFLGGDATGVDQMTLAEYPVMPAVASAGAQDALVARVDSAGGLSWVRRFGGAGSTTKALGLAFQPASGVTVTGQFSATADFDLTPTNNGGRDVLHSAGGPDIFVARLAVDGAFAWAARAGQSVNYSGYEGGYGVAVDPDGGAYFAGTFEGEARFGTQTLVARGSEDAFVAKVDAAGTFAWARGMGGLYTGATVWHDRANGVAVHRDTTGDSVYVTGWFDPEFGPGQFGRADQDGAGAAELYGYGYHDAFVSKLAVVPATAAGPETARFVWTRALGGAGLDHGAALGVDAAGYVYTSGHFDGLVDFDPGPGRALLAEPATGESDAYLWKLDPAGDFVSARRFGGPGVSNQWEVGRGLAFGTGQSLYLAGQYDPGAELETDTGSAPATGYGSFDAFLLKLEQSRGAVFGRALAQRDTDGALVPAVGQAVTLTGTAADGTPVSLSATTGQLGEYLFRFLKAGTYTVEAGGTSRTLTLADGQFATDQDLTLAISTATKTFTNSTARGVPDGGKHSSTIKVSHPSSAVWDADVVLTINHPNVEDLDVVLVAPDGTRVELFSDVGGTGDNFTGTRLDDDAGASVRTATAPFTGRFRPEHPLFVFNGKGPNGTWTLEVTDDTRNGLKGTLVSWSLTITGPASDGPLVAAKPGTANGAPELTAEGLRPVVAEAVRRWILTGLTPAEQRLLKSVQFQITDLDGATLGQAAGTTIALDATAAGHGWFVDSSPRTDSEFTRKGDQGEQGRMDLLTAVMHELGHVLGHEHGDGAMAETLTASTRETIVPGVHVAKSAIAKPALGPSWFLSSGRARR